jgi:polyvinyl alcohol dehydrogenase (cytochrome)
MKRQMLWPSLVVLVAALAGCAGDEAPAAPAAPQAVASVTPPANHGETLYRQRCATCHDNATDRTPARAVIAANPPAFIYNALRNGVMQPMAAGLSEDDMKAIALYLSPQTGGRGTAGDPNVNAIWGASSASMPLDGPRCAAAAPAVNLAAADQWNGWSPGKDNARYQTRPGLAASDVPRLRVKWAFRYPGSKNGQATVIGERLFVTSMSGAIYALNARTGCVYWRHDAPSATRSSVSVGPITANGRTRTALYFSDWSKSAAALDAETGEEIWRTQIEDQTGVQMTGAPTLWRDVLLVPISTGNEAFATNDNYECCKFIGSLVALDARTGRILWKRYTTDQRNLPYRLNARGQQMWGPAGGSIWSAPTIDAARGLAYVSTSNSHTDAPNEGSNSVIAINLRTGEVAWRNQVWPNDNYIIGCPRAANCPAQIGPDFALGASPILHTGRDGRQLLLAGQKSGILWALDPADNGKLVWKRQLSPGSALGGIEFGPAADEDRVYVGISDVVLPADRSRAGMYALRISDGEIVWSAPTPRLTCRWRNNYCNPAISQAVTVIPGIVFAGSMDGHFRAYQASDGKVVWDYDTAGQPHRTVLGEEAYGGVIDGAGPTVAGGMVYVHSGYAGRQTANPNDLTGRDGNLLLAFSVDGR